MQIPGKFPTWLAICRYLWCSALNSAAVGSAQGTGSWEFDQRKNAAERTFLALAFLFSLFLQMQIPIGSCTAWRHLSERWRHILRRGKQWNKLPPAPGRLREETRELIAGWRVLQKRGAPSYVHGHLITSSRQTTREQTEAWEMVSDWVRGLGEEGKRWAMGTGEEAAGAGVPVIAFLSKECTSRKVGQCSGWGIPLNVYLFCVLVLHIFYISTQLRGPAHLHPDRSYTFRSI